MVRGASPPRKSRQRYYSTAKRRFAVLMVIGVLTLELYVRHSQSLKDKRRVIKSLKDRLRSRFNVSVAEIGSHDHKKCAQLGIAAIGVDAGYVQGALEEVKQAASMDPVAELGRSDIEFY